MNEPAVKMEEQIINLFQEVETEVYEGWVLKTLGSRLIVFPLYNVYPDNMDERIRACERLGNEKSAECMFRIAENTNFYLHSRLEKNRYILRERTIVGDLSITEETADRFSLYGRIESENEDRTESIIESRTAGRVEKAPAIDIKPKPGHRRMEGWFWKRRRMDCGQSLFICCKKGKTGAGKRPAAGELAPNGGIIYS